MPSGLEMLLNGEEREKIEGLKGRLVRQRRDFDLERCFLFGGETGSAMVMIDGSKGKVFRSHYGDFSPNSLFLTLGYELRGLNSMVEDGKGEIESLEVNEILVSIHTNSRYPNSRLGVLIKNWIEGSNQVLKLELKLIYSVGICLHPSTGGERQAAAATEQKKAEAVARDIWHNLKMGHFVCESAWGKFNLTAKAMAEGGFESLFKQTFPTEPNEKLKNTFACYLSTTTGPVAGTLYLSTARAAFCSDRPMSFIAPSGQEAWCYYKAMIPLANIATVNPVIMREKSSEKYIQIVTVAGPDFWFMGFVNFEKASHHLLDSLSDF
ncbi:hypothetical protein HYC85_020421 [Camellia sinensis]|uniref:GRAM domain-containing protein n=1 Tax=Camellia sinensis TaxID=4442 RepID=A0A7J7GPP9_CAMSI|nr:hypothetical protein HYC85_020421 [Camellia sinensis]